MVIWVFFVETFADVELAGLEDLVELVADIIGLSQCPEIEEILITELFRLLTLHPSIVDIQQCLMIAGLRQKFLLSLDETFILFLVYPQNFLPDTLSREHAHKIYHCRSDIE